MMKREDAMKIAEQKLQELAQALEQGRSQVLEGTRIFSHFADAYPCGLRISTADRLADSDAAPLPDGKCPVGMLSIAWPNSRRHIRFAAYPARPAGGT